MRYLGNAGVHKSSNNLVITVIVALRDVLGALKIKIEGGVYILYKLLCNEDIVMWKEKCKFAHKTIE